MPIRSRLLGLFIILLAGNSAFAATDANEFNTVVPNSTPLDPIILKITEPVAQASPVNAREAGVHETIAPEVPINPATATVSAAPAQPLPQPVVRQSVNEQPVNTDEQPIAAVPIAPIVVTSAPVVESHKMGNTQCANGDKNLLQKSLLVVAFPRNNPSMANAGELYQVEQLVPQLLSQDLMDKHTAIIPVQLSESLLTPDINNDTQLAMQIQRLARSQHSQLVLSGEIVDMSMAHPEATYSPGLYTRTMNNFFDFIEARNRFDKRDRLFSFQVHLRDGFTGQQVFTKRYDTYGLWVDTGKVGFGSALFWKSDYGKQVRGVIRKAAKDMGDVIQCQPFMAQIDSRPGQTQIILQSGSNNGLHTGDMLSLYQLVIEGSETQYQQHDIRLVNRNSAIELREVYPSHSVGVISNTAYLTGQFLAVAP